MDDTKKVALSDFLIYINTHTHIYIHRIFKEPFVTVAWAIVDPGQRSGQKLCLLLPLLA